MTVVPLTGGNPGQIEPVNAETTTLQQSVTTYMDVLDKTADSQLNALSRQNDVQNLLSYETGRLKNKKKAIDDAMKAQGRIIFFNDNSRKWYAAYLKIILILVVILAIIFALKLLSDNFSTIIPLWILQIAFILTITIGIIVIFGVYAENARHSRYNYDELNMTSPDVEITDPSDSTNATPSPFNMGLPGVCMGEACCTEGTTIWDDTTQKCIPIKQPFTTMNNISPTDAFEYAEYAPYN